MQRAYWLLACILFALEASNALPICLFTKFTFSSALHVGNSKSWIRSQKRSLLKDFGTHRFIRLWMLLEVYDGVPISYINA